MQISPTPGGAGRYSASAGAVFPSHAHREWEFVFYTRGSAVVRQGGEDIPVTAGTLVTTGPGVTHRETAIAGYSNIYLQVFADPGATFPTVVRDDAAGGMARVLESLVDEDPAEVRMRALLLAQLELLISRLSAAPATSNPQRELVVRAERRLRDRLSKPFPLSALAAELGAAPSTLRAAFVRERGMPPRDRFQEIRMQQALAQLRGSTLTLEHIARITGFSSASHLSRSVQSATGRSPRDIRRE